MKIVTDYFKNAYYHCLHYIVNKRLHLVERIFWVVCTILSMAGALYVVHESLKSLNRKSTFSVNTNYLSFRTPYPSVVFCQNKLTDQRATFELGRKLFNGDLNINEVELMEATAFFTPFDTNSLQDQGFCVADAIKDVFNLTNTFNETICPYTKQVIGYNIANYRTMLESNCSNMFTHCEFNGEKFDCCEKFRAVPSFTGTCYAMNSFVGNVLEKNLTDMSDMLKKTGWINYKGALDFFIESKPGKNPARLLVELYDEVLLFYLSPFDIVTRMFQLTEDSHLEVQDQVDGNYVKIFLRVEETLPDDSVLSIKSVEKRGCRFWSEYSANSLLPFYSPSICELQCIKKLQQKFCNCSSHGLPRLEDEDYPTCDLFGLLCVNNPSGAASILPDLLDECSSKCDSNCHDLKVYKVGSYASKNMEQNIVYKNPRSKRAMDIFVSSPYIQYERHVFKEKLDFMVSVGGAVSLFIGCSYMSISQLFYYFMIKPISEYLRARRQKKIDEKERKLRETFLKQRQKLNNYFLEEAIRKKMSQKLNENRNRLF